ncbi:MAG: gamma-glutamylcyclotransferase [Gammaproteobacteria bacterium]|nr:gamma-glutamylcyclotransferase [Gammaproteobacteria bacterium]
MNRLFAYGTLMFAEVFAAVCGTTRPAHPARLPGHARHALRGRVYPGLVARPGALTAGLLFDDIDAALWARLDAFEGALYDRRTVTVELADGPTAAAVYLLAPRAHRLLEDAAWDAEAFRTRHLATYLGKL